MTPEETAALADRVRAAGTGPTAVTLPADDELARRLFAVSEAAEVSLTPSIADVEEFYDLWVDQEEWQKAGWRRVAPLFREALLWSWPDEPPVAG